jgi:hypothetical protein
MNRIKIESYKRYSDFFKIYQYEIAFKTILAKSDVYPLKDLKKILNKKFEHEQFIFIDLLVGYNHFKKIVNKITDRYSFEYPTSHNCMFEVVKRKAILITRFAKPNKFYMISSKKLKEISEAISRV